MSPNPSRKQGGRPSGVYQRCSKKSTREQMWDHRSSRPAGHENCHDDKHWTTFAVAIIESVVGRRVRHSQLKTHETSFIQGNAVLENSNHNKCRLLHEVKKKHPAYFV